MGVARGTRVVAVADIELSSLAARLDPRTFARVHRSAVVNLERVARPRPLRGGDYALTMRNGEGVTMSRSHGDDVLRRLRAR